MKLGTYVRAAAVAAAGFSVAFGVSTSAFAADSGYAVVVVQGSDQAALSPGRYYGEVCDMERDGRSVHATFYTKNGLTVVTDKNGSTVGCGKTGNLHTAITNVQICEEVAGPGDDCAWWR